MMDAYQMWAAITMATAFAGAYIIWGPTQKYKQIRGHINGLENWGNICFINASLQALSACQTFLTWLSKNKNHKTVLFNALHTTFGEINNEESNSGNHVTCKLVFDALRKHKWILSEQEQDTHEFYHALTTSLEEETFEIMKDNLTFKDLSQLETNFCKTFHHHYRIISKAAKPAPKSSILFYSPLRGLLVNQIKCNSCGYKFPLQYDTFDSLSLAIPHRYNGKVVSLQDCLNTFISEELVPDATCENCSVKGGGDSPQKTALIKQLLIGKLPECLVFHINRTKWIAGVATVKCHDFIHFPEFLNMSPYLYWQKQSSCPSPEGIIHSGDGLFNTESSDPISELDTTHHTSNMLAALIKSSQSNGLDSSRFNFRLTSVIVHIGDTQSGHFITYRRGTHDRWFFTSDLEVRSETLHEVLRANAFMLFYEKYSLS